MIVSTIRQFGLRLRADPEEIPFQYSANVQMKFEKDENYNDYTVVGYYIPPGQHEAKLLSINDDGTFILGPDCFKQRGTLSFSFNLINSQEEVHLGSIDFEVRYTFGDSSAILPEFEEVWISLVNKVAKDAIKEEVALVKQKANEALQSASLANDKASEAKEYANNANQSANSANLSASSALTAKNDAIAASNSAIQAKQDAEQSANNAKNSANTALENANKSTEAIETVTQIKIEIENKANDFDTNYQEKLNAFNDNATEKQSTFNQNVTSANTNFDNKVTQANSDLDAKVQEANTIIDEKVKTATEQAQKAKEEANRAEQATDGKLDKNLGVENAGKSLVVGENGEVVCGESGINEDEVNKIIDKAIDEKLYTQEEVDYMLSDKMDKPYVSIEITDSATITDALEGNLKIDMIKGNTVQKQETDIVPTPQRPVPINSRKVKAGDEYVELRSLKETINQFDLGLLSQVDLIPDDGNSYRKIKIPIKLKPQVRYNFYYENFMIPGLSWLVLNIVNSTGNTIFTAFNVNNSKNNEEIEVTGRSVAFNAPSDGEVYFSYYARLYNSDGIGIRPSIEMFKENWFTKYVKNIMITEASLNQTTYVAPTVRDYKIVNHETKTSKIIRNVGLYVDDKTGDSWDVYDLKGNYKYGYLRHMEDMKPSNRIASYVNVFRCEHNANPSHEYALWMGVNNNYLYFTKTDFTTLDEWKAWLASNDLSLLYPLVTPVEESIAYVETDVSEVGYSWQDTTSPSPTIKSEVQGVKKIDILKTGKNLIDGYDNFALLKSGTYYLSTNTLTTSSRIDFGLYDENKKLIREDIVTFTGSQFYLQANGTYRLSNNANSIKSKITFHDERVKFIKIIYIDIYVKFDEIQLEVGDIATAYEPYTRQHINITPPQPMYGNYDGSICDIADVESGNYDYYFKQKTGNTLNNISVQSVKSKTALIVIPKVNNGFPQTQFSCDCNMFESKAGSINGREDDEEFINSESSMYSIYINVKKDRLTTYDTAGAVEFITNSNMIISYPDTTPTTLPIPEDDLAKLKSLKTNAGVNNIFINGEVKPVVEARYPQDVVLAVNRLQTKLLTLQEEVVKNV